MESENASSWTTLLPKIEALCALAAPRSVALQLRNKTHPVRERLEVGRQLRQISESYSQLLLINDRLDLAMLLHADGVHLGGDAVPVQDARALLGPRSFVSVAWHVGEAVPSEGADAAVVSPVFAARKGREGIGLDGLRAAVTALGVPSVYALGGVAADNAAQCLHAGAAGVAAIGAVTGERPPADLLMALGALR